MNRNADISHSLLPLGSRRAEHAGKRILPRRLVKAGIGGTCRGKGQRGDRRRTAGKIDVCRSLAVEQDELDRKTRAERGYIRRLKVADGGVLAAADVALRHDVPQRDLSSEQKRLLFLYGLGHRLAEKRGDDTPESVLPIAVIKLDLAALDGGKTPEDQQPCILPEKRLKAAYSV